MNKPNYLLLLSLMCLSSISPSLRADSSSADPQPRRKTHKEKLNNFYRAFEELFEDPFEDVFVSMPHYTPACKCSINQTEKGVTVTIQGIDDDINPTLVKNTLTFKTPTSQIEITYKNDVVTVYGFAQENQEQGEEQNKMVRSSRSQFKNSCYVNKPLDLSTISVEQNKETKTVSITIPFTESKQIPVNVVK